MKELKEGMIFEINVTQRDIDLSNRFSPDRAYSCPVAKAAKRKFGKPVSWVHGMGYIYRDLNIILENQVPIFKYNCINGFEHEKANKISLNFDLGKEVKPGKFKVILVKPIM